MLDVANRLMAEIILSRKELGREPSCLFVTRPELERLQDELGALRYMGKIQLNEQARPMFNHIPLLITGEKSA